MKDQLTKTQVKSALHKVKGNFPFNWDLNVYRGCGHGCVYCYALYSHDYLKDHEDFYRNIYVKENLAEVLEREFQKKSWKGEMVNLGGVTDSYQPLERQVELMPDILRVFIKYRNPLTISTKSHLILRDIDLYTQLASLTHVNISVTVTTPNDAIKKHIEPFASKSKDRFKVLKGFSRTPVSTGLHVMPIIPFLTDDEEDLEQLFQMAAENRVDYLLTGKLYLRGKTRPRFIDFMRQQYPEHFAPFSKVFTNEEAKQQYTRKLYEKINRLRRKYTISSGYKHPVSASYGQLSLF
ncbi:MAG: radical SAM protein [Thermotogota bacterium]